MGKSGFTLVFIILFSTWASWALATVPVNNNIANTPATACTPADFGGACSASGGGTVTSVSATSPLQITGGSSPTPTVAIIGSTGSGTNFVLATSPTISNLIGTGNVGLGTTNIAGTGLDVQGTLRIFGGNSTVTIGTTVNGNSGNSLLTVGTFGLFNVDNSGNIQSETINSSNSGGTNTFSGFMDTFGGIRLRSTTNILFGSFNNQAIQTDADSSTANLIFDTNGQNNEKMRITNSGNVGISSINPGTILDVNGTVRMTGFTLTGQGAASGYILQSSGSLGIGTWVPAPTGGGGGSGTVNSGTTRQIGYYASSTTAISGSSAITVSGASSGNNIGIGSATPGALLDVQGTVRIMGGGNVGIGTSTVNQSLFVQGNAFFLNSLYGTENFSTASSITCTGNYKYCSMVNTQGAATFTVNKPTNAYINGQTLIIIISSTSAQTFSWASGSGGFVGGNLGLPTTSDATGNWQYFGFIYDSTNNHWDFTGNPSGYN